MAIRFSCACGQQLDAPDDAAGRAARCPGCGTGLTVPEPARLASEEAAESPTKVCPFCSETILEAARKCRHCGEYLDGSAPVQGGDDASEIRRDLSMEAHLRAIALWYRIGAILGGVGVVLGICGGLATRSGGVAAEGEVLVVLIMLFAGAILVAMYALGHYLHHYSNVARIVAGVLTALGVVAGSLSILGSLVQGNPAEAFSNVFSTAYYGAILWALFNARSAWICTPDYRRAVEIQPHIKPATLASPFFWVPFAMFCLMFALLFVVAGFLGGV